MSLSDKPKKRGRPATGRDPMIGLRASSELRAMIDEWAEKQSDQPSRSEAIRRLVELGLNLEPRASRKTARGRAIGVAYAKQMAGDSITHSQVGGRQSRATKAKRRKQLTDMPVEFADKNRKRGS